MNKGSNKKDVIGMQIANPNLIIQKRTLEKRMNWDPKTPLKEIFKNDDLTRSRTGEAFSKGRPLAC